jgi:hypothetical protein
MMKKGMHLSNLKEVQAEFAQFNTCHHCKYLYPDYLLMTCKFTSDKQVMPKASIEATFDPDITDILPECML